MSAISAPPCDADERDDDEHDDDDDDGDHLNDDYNHYHQLPSYRSHSLLCARLSETLSSLNSLVCMSLCMSGITSDEARIRKPKEAKR